MTIHRIPTPMPPAIDFAGRDRSGIGADDEHEARTQVRQPLLTLSISATANHLTLAEVRAETITEKTALGNEMTPRDFEALSDATVSAGRLWFALNQAKNQAIVIGRELAIVATEERPKLDEAKLLDVLGRLVEFFHDSPEQVDVHLKALADALPGLLRQARRESAALAEVEQSDARVLAEDSSR